MKPFLLMALVAMSGTAPLTSQSEVPAGPRSPANFHTVTLPQSVRTSWSLVWSAANHNWQAAPDVPAFLKGTGSGLPLEYLGCIRGHVHADTLHVTGWATARDLKRWPNSLYGTCHHVLDLVGTWHTHQWDASPDGQPIKWRDLSPKDLSTLALDRGQIAVAVWDRDSLSIATRQPDGTITFPAPDPLRW